MDINAFTRRIRKAKTPDRLFRLLVSEAARLGFEWIAYVALKDRGRYGASAHPAPAVRLTYPRSWIDTYVTQNLQASDPVFLYSFQIGAPYLWQWLPSAIALTAKELSVLRKAKRAGLAQGMTVPLASPCGTTALLSFATASANADIEAHLGRLGFEAAQFHRAYVHMMGVQPPSELIKPLTPRERECLHWIAAGKSSYEIGIILGLSAHTVRSYTKAILQKLNTTNRAMAVTRAIQLHLLDE